MRRTDVFQIRIEPELRDRLARLRDERHVNPGAWARDVIAAALVRCRPTSRRRRDNPSPAGNPASSGTAGTRCSTDRCRRARGGPVRHSDQHHRQPGRLLDGYDHRGRLPQPAAHRRPRLRPAVGLHATLDTLSVAQELTAGGIDRDQAEVIANATGQLAEQGDQRHGRPAEGRSHRGPHPTADGNCRYPHRLSTVS